MEMLLVLGASDPEMQAIECLLKKNGVLYAYAVVANSRVHPGNAYQAVSLRWPGLEGGPGWEAVTHLVECDRLEPLPVVVVRIDHHRGGDSGFGKPPSDYWGASSIGQVYSLLNVEPTGASRLAAAGDHCPGAAYRGLCPGIDPDELIRWRAESRAAFQKRSVQDVLADVSKARVALFRSAGEVVLCASSSFIETGCGHENCGCEPMGYHPQTARSFVGRTKSPPELPEAALREGIAYLAELEEGGRAKIVLGGNAPNQEDCVRQFLGPGGYAQRAGLVDIYGDPARGFAGGYLP